MPSTGTGPGPGAFGAAALAAQALFLVLLVLELHGPHARAGTGRSVPVTLALILVAACLLAALGSLMVAERRRRGLLRHTERLRGLVSTDPLTELGNRRSFDEALSLAWRDASRRGAVLSLVLADADHFKSFNDLYGHLEGDRLLQAAGKVLTSALRRPADQAFRIGGEEFAILLPDTDAAGAAVVAATIRAGIVALPTRHRSGVDGRFTLSMGIAQATPTRGEADRQRLFDAADRALYRAKSDGRNRIRVTALVGSNREEDARPDASIGGLEILLPGGRSLSISEAISLSTLQSVLGVLKDG